MAVLEVATIFLLFDDDDGDGGDGECEQKTYIQELEVARTKVSRESDVDIDELTALLVPFVALYLANGFFTSSEQAQISLIFRQHAERQYFRGQDYADKITGEQRPLTQRDLDNI